jgi:hypothetical protein
LFSPERLNQWRGFYFVFVQSVFVFEGQTLTMGGDQAYILGGALHVGIKLTHDP